MEWGLRGNSAGTRRLNYNKDYCVCDSEQGLLARSQSKQTEKPKGWDMRHEEEGRRKWLVCVLWSWLETGVQVDARWGMKAGNADAFRAGILTTTVFFHLCINSLCLHKEMVFLSLVWKNLTSLHRFITSTPLITFGMNWIRPDPPTDSFWPYSKKDNTPICSDDSWKWIFPNICAAVCTPINNTASVSFV